MSDIDIVGIARPLSGAEQSVEHVIRIINLSRLVHGGETGGVYIASKIAPDLG